MSYYEERSDDLVVITEAYDLSLIESKKKGPNNNFESDLYNHHNRNNSNIST